MGLQVAAYFTQNPKYHFLDFAGLGRHGGALVLAELSDREPPGVERMLVIKYSYGALVVDNDANADGDADLRNEYYWLRRLRGAEHIVQLVEMEDCDINLPGISDGQSSYDDSVRNLRDTEAAAAAAAGGDGGGAPLPLPRRCPTFALEYLIWGTLRTFHKRIVDGGVTWLPSRLLWQLWLCMVRQCVAMAFPPDVPEDDYVEGLTIREIIKDQPFFQLTQNSPHFANFVFSSAVAIPGNEHEPRLPVMKLIDFGRGREEPYSRAERKLPSAPAEFASRANLFMAAASFMEMCCLYAGPGADFDMMTTEVQYFYTHTDGTVKRAQTQAPFVLRNNNLIDPQLRHLLVRILAYSSDGILSLPEVLAETEAASNKGPDDPSLITPAGMAAGVSETDETIKDIMQRYMYNASSQ
ncbi:hypothetical protein F4859DRAFT_511643 [Xylaria cf. heliscus]|nr:hypothetical protein F4859DRAFT_511643 [Xylaria cf. heliscus]